jgi:uracil phosphoribosyltransferase
MIYNLGDHNSLITQYVAELRDKAVQLDRLRFTRNLERIAMLLAYEVSKSLEWTTGTVSTPLASAPVRILAQQPVVCSILRAGLAMHHGVTSAFDKADSAFVSAYRKHDDDGGFHIQLGYMTCPDINDRILLMVDPMLATGRSLVACTEAVLSAGAPQKIHILTAIAAREGLRYVETHLPEADIWVAAVDEELNPQAYIVPGLGDAGDLAFGPKLQS